MAEISVEMSDLMFAALDFAVASIEESGPLIPFVKQEKGTDLFGS